MQGMLDALTSSLETRIERLESFFTADGDVLIKDPRGGIVTIWQIIVSIGAVCGIGAFGVVIGLIILMARGMPKP